MDNYRLCVVLEASDLSDAGNWSAIVAAAILVTGIVAAWFQRLSHALHVVTESIALQALDDDDEPGDIGIIVGLDLWNTSSIPLAYEVTSFEVEVGDRSAEDLDRLGERRESLAPQQRSEWTAEPVRVTSFDFPATVTARYELEYARKPRRLWGLRRRINGSFRGEIPFLHTVGPIAILVHSVDGPTTDSFRGLASLRTPRPRGERQSP